MKTKLRFLLVGSLLLAFTGLGQAQTLIQFWDFNQTHPTSGAGGDSLGTVYSYANNLGTDTTNSTWPLYPDYSKVTGAKIVYYRPQTHYYALAPDSILDNGNGGSFYYDYSSNNYPYFSSSDSGFGEGNGFIRARNPSDSCEMWLYIPTTGYKDISLQFAITQSSSKGATYNIFSYSTNGGTTWKNLTTAMDTFNIGGVYYPDTLQASNPITVNSNWYPVQMNFASDTAVNNNANFILRFRLAGSTSSLNKGNDRYDNFAVWGSTLTGINEVNAHEGYSVYPNPARNMISLNCINTSEKVITIYNVLGEQVNKVTSRTRTNTINVSQFPSGLYFINVKETASGANTTLKFVKN